MKIFFGLLILTIIAATCYGAVPNNLSPSSSQHADLETSASYGYGYYPYHGGYPYYGSYPYGGYRYGGYYGYPHYYGYRSYPYYYRGYPYYY